MRISDWSSDVCSSDLAERHHARPRGRGTDGAWRGRCGQRAGRARQQGADIGVAVAAGVALDGLDVGPERIDRTSVVEGTSVSVRVDLGGRRSIKTKTTKENRTEEI